MNDVIVRASAREMVEALKLPRVARAPAEAVARALSIRLARALAELDADARAHGVARGAGRGLAALGARVARVTLRAARPPEAGALLVVSNHPGAYDALALASALGRADLAILAADRAFLRALAGLAEKHLIFIDENAGPAARVVALRRAFAHLDAGGALLHFGAGAIEPDPAFFSAIRDRRAPILGAWRAGTAVLARAAWRARGLVVPAMVSGVHSPRAKRMSIVRWAESRGVTTLAPLLQVALPWLRDVDVTVAFGAAVESGASDESGQEEDTAIVATIRDACEELAAYA